MMADAADEELALIRQFDKSCMPTSQVRSSVQAFVDRIEFLFLRAAATDMGYTGYADALVDKRPLNLTLSDIIMGFLTTTDMEFPTFVYFQPRPSISWGGNTLSSLRVIFVPLEETWPNWTCSLEMISSSYF